MYEASDIKVGQVLLCVDNGGFPCWTTGKRYEVVADEQGKPRLYTDNGELPLSHRTANDISVYLNSQPNNGDVVMQIVEDKEEEKQMFKKGDKVKCINKGGYSNLTQGKIYEVARNEDVGYVTVVGDTGGFTEYYTTRFELLEEEKKMYKEDDIKIGQVLLCVEDGDYDFWTEGKRYEVVADELGKPCIYSDSGYDAMNHRNAIDIAIYLNNEPNNYDVVMQLMEDEQEEKKVYTLDDLKEGMVLRCIDDRGYGFWTTGKEYPVYKDENGVYIVDDEGSKSRNRNLLNRLNDKGSNARMEIVSTPAEPAESEEITLTITGSNYQELLDQATELKRLLNVHVTNSNTAQEALQTITETFGGAK